MIMMYVIYVVIVVGVLWAGYILAEHQQKMLTTLRAVHTPAIIDRFHEPELAPLLQHMVILEHGTMKYIMMPFAAMCSVAMIAVPFYFQMEIPTPVGIGMAAAVGWLFTYVLRKDFYPTWYLLALDLISAVIFEHMTELVSDQQDQTLSGQTQSNQQE